MRFEYFNLLQLQGSRAWFVTSEPKQTEAVFQICTTLFIATLLFGMFILFSRDVTSMVVRPIESMIDIVRKLAQNPTLKLEGQTKSKYETEAVRIALAKIVGLMQLGFGGAHPSPNPDPNPSPNPNPDQVACCPLRGRPTHRAPSRASPKTARRWWRLLSRSSSRARRRRPRPGRTR